MRKIILGIVFVFILIQIHLTVAETASAPENRQPVIEPDYSNILIPPNIAPLNFIVREPGRAFQVRIFGDRGNTIHIRSKKPTIDIPMKKWKKLLEENRGLALQFEISVQNASQKWTTFQPIMNTVSVDSIDSHVAYRLINPGYVLWWKMGLYQRNIETFQESPIMTNRVTSNNCMNCHSFCRNNPDKMLFHMRGDYGGTMLIQDGNIQKINTKTDYTMSAGVYPSWHPGGQHVAFSVNKINQFFHSVSETNLHVADLASDIIVYDLKKNQVTTSPLVSTKRMENLPAWSPDGQYLYFISSPEWQQDKDYSTIHYDLMKIHFDVKTGKWGQVETLLNASSFGKSISFPKPSPDGKYVLLTMSDYGYFTIHSKSADLYLLNLENDHLEKVDVNSEHCESYHSWSSDSHWIVFVSKREDGLCSRLYFSHIDENGQASKPILMPQKDPAFYKTFIQNYNRPELITGPVDVKYAQLIQSARQAPMTVQFDSTVNVDALSGASRIAINKNGKNAADGTAIPYQQDSQ